MMWADQECIHNLIRLRRIRWLSWNMLESDAIDYRWVSDVLALERQPIYFHILGADMLAYSEVDLDRRACH
jgi:hypothetical protein